MAIPEITVDELRALGPDICLIDVREDHEWREGRVPFARHVPLGAVPGRIDAFEGEPTYVMCKVGGRSLHACEYLAAQGKAVVNVAGGMIAWLLAGHDTVADS